MPPQPSLVLRPEVGQQDNPRARHALDEAVEQRLRFAVRPLEVLEDQEQGLALTLAQQERHDGVERALAALRGIKPLPARVFGGHVEQRQEGGDGRLDRLVERAQPCADLGAALARAVARLDLEVALEQLRDRQIRRGLAVGERPAFEDQPLGPGHGLRDLVEEPRFADAGLAHDGHDLATARLRLRERCVELVELGSAPDEAREPPARRGLQPRARPAGARDLEDLERDFEALDRHRAQRPRLDIALGQAECFRRGQHGAGRGHLLHPRGQMRGLADRRVAHAQVAADRAHDDLAGVEADADLDRDALGPAHLFGVALDGILHAERRVAGAHRVILMGERRPEERHDAVAHDLVDRALVLVNGLHHVLEDGVEDLARLFGIAIRQELHRALEVGEEDGDLLALPLDRAPRGEDFLREVPGRIRLGRGEARPTAWLRVHRQPALAAETDARAELGAARGAGEREPRAALGAEPRRGGSVVLAARTVHGASE